MIGDKNWLAAQQTKRDMIRFDGYEADEIVVDANGDLIVKNKKNKEAQKEA